METAAAALSAPKVEPRACAELDVSPLFVSGCVGNVALARQKWEKARQWRQRFDIDKILERPHPLFCTIDSLQTQCFLPNARNGDAVYLSKPGQAKVSHHIDITRTLTSQKYRLRWSLFLSRVVTLNNPYGKPRALAANNIMPEDMMHHTAFLMEFGLRHLRADPNKHLQVMVYDLDGANIWHLDTRTLRCIRDCAALYQQSYVGHERAVLLINAPAIFPVIWKFLQPFVKQTMRRNIYVASKGCETYSLLARFLDHKDIPAEYDGGLVLPRGLNADRHLIQPQARLVELIGSLQRTHPDCKEHMPVV